MILAEAITAAVLFGTGTFLMLKRDLFRVVAGIVLISQSANVTIIASGLTRGAVPIYPLATAERISDPLTQAMTLTAIVITFGITALLLSLLYRVYLTYESVDEQVVTEERDRDEEQLEELREIDRW